MKEAAAKIMEQIRSFSSLKVNIALHVIYYKMVDPSTVTDPPLVLQSQPFEFSADDGNEEIRPRIALALANFEQQSETYQMGGSGWVLDKYWKVELTFAKLARIRSGAHLEIPPSWHKSARYCFLNVENKRDDLCLVYCYLAHMDRRKVMERPHPGRFGHYKDRLNEVKISGMHILLFQKKKKKKMLAYYGGYGARTRADSRFAEIENRD